MNVISSVSCTCLVILLTGIIPPVPQICGYTHWTVSQYDMIESLTSSYYHLRQSWDLIELLRQERSWQLVQHLERTLERVSNELASTERRQIRLERRLSNRDSDCAVSARLIVQRELHPSHVLTLEDAAGISSIELLQPDLLHQWPSIGPAELWQPLCTRLFEAPEFSMCCFEHLVSVRNRSMITGAPEPAVRERAIPPSLTTAEFGHLVTLALLEGGRHDPQRAWMLFNMAAFFWRARGDARNASECLRAALFYSPWKQREVALAGLAGVLRHSGTASATRDALVLMQNALLLVPQRPSHHLVLGALFDALSRPRDALDHYKRATLLLRATPVTKDNSELVKELEERSRAASCSVEAAAALAGQQDALDRQLDRLEAFQRDIGTVEMVKRELRDRALDNITQNLHETQFQEFDVINTDLDGLGNDAPGRDDHSVLASVFGNLGQRDKAHCNAKSDPVAKDLVRDGSDQAEQPGQDRSDVRGPSGDRETNGLSQSYQYCGGHRDPGGVTMSAVEKRLVDGSHGDGVGSGNDGIGMSGDENEEVKQGISGEKKTGTEDTIENDNDNGEGIRVAGTDQNGDERIRSSSGEVKFLEKGNDREHRAGKRHSRGNILERRYILESRGCRENNVKEGEMDDGPMTRGRDNENLDGLCNKELTEDDEAVHRECHRGERRDRIDGREENRKTGSENGNCEADGKIGDENGKGKTGTIKAPDSREMEMSNNREQITANNRDRGKNNEEEGRLVVVKGGQDKQSQPIRSPTEDNAMSTVDDRDDSQRQTRQEKPDSRGLEGPPPPIRMNVSLCDRLACDPVTTGDRSYLAEVPVAVAGFLMPFDKDFELSGLLSRLERPPLPWYPPMCAGHVNISSLRRETLLETMEILVDSAKGFGSKPADRPLDEPYLSRILWDLVGGDRTVPLADIGQRVLTVLEKRLAPHWIVLQLAALYWRVAGEPGSAIECLQLALRSSPVQSRGVALFNLAAVLARLRHHGDAIKLVAAALHANRSEPASHMLAAQLQLIHGHLHAAFHHVSVALRHDSSRPLGPALLQLVSCKLCLKHNRDNANWNQALKIQTLKRNVTQIFINYKMCSSTAECDNIIGKNYQYLPHVKVHIKGPTFSPLDIKNLNTDLYSLNHHVARPNIMYGILWNTNFSNLHIQGHECLLINDTSRSVGCHLNEEIFEASQNAVNFLTELKTLLENVSSHLNTDVNTVMKQDSKQHFCLGNLAPVSKAPPLLVGSSSLQKVTKLIAPKSTRNILTPKDCENVTPFNFKSYTPLYISLNTMRFNVAFFVDSLNPGYTFSFSRHPYCVPSGDNLLRRILDKYQIDFRSIPASKDPEHNLRVSFMQTFGDKYSLDEIGEKLYAGLHSNSTDWRLATISVNYWRVVGDAREASNCLELALENGPKFYEKVLLVNAASILYRIDLLEAAIEVTEKSMNYPDSKNWVVIPFLMANIFAAMEQWHRAMVFYEACLSIKADFKEAIYRIKSIHCQHIFPETLSRH